MDEAANRYARELIDAIHTAVARDPGVQACRDRAKAAGVELKVSVEAVGSPSRRQMPAPRTYDITAADRRFLRSLRIAAAETPEEV